MIEKSENGLVHDIDPVLGQLSSLYLWHYGLIYSLGFLAIFLWAFAVRRQNQLTTTQVYDFSILVSIGVLIGGRLIAVFFYEWDFYGSHFPLIPAYWIGGMASHGLLLGAIAGLWIFARVHNRPFLTVSDMLVVPGALLMAFGRIANFIDGQIVGSVTDVPWAIKFPDAEGFRHPVVLYDSLKNLLLVPLLLAVGRTRPKPGVLTGHFMLWYGFLRIFVDLFRDYRVDLGGIPTGQILNGTMAIAGLVLLLWSASRFGTTRVDARTAKAAVGSGTSSAGIWWRALLFALILCFSLVIPSDRTQDVPNTYGKRHAGMEYSRLYPTIGIR